MGHRANGSEHRLSGPSSRLRRRSPTLAGSIPSRRAHALAVLRRQPAHRRLRLGIRFLSPWGILLSLWVVLRERTRDAYLIALLALSAFLGWYCFVGFPEFLAKLTLMSLSTGGLYSKASSRRIDEPAPAHTRPRAPEARPSRIAAAVVAIVASGAIMAGSAAAFSWFYNAASFAACALVLIGGMYLLLRSKAGADGAS